jgi:nitroreductase
MAQRHDQSIAAADEVGLTDRSLEDCVRAATAAPSIHNSQPWRFRIRDGGIDVFADWRRRLDVVDPSGRELLMSVGAAVFNLRVAMWQLSREPRTRLSPDAAEPDLIVRVVPGQSQYPSADQRALAAAIPRRHTNRQPFAQTAISAAILDELTAAARRESARLHVADVAGRNAILGLVREAEQRLRARGVYRAELTGLPRAGHGRHHGMPGQAHGPWQAIEALPLRDFGLREPELRRPIDPYEPYPTIMVLSTEGDHPDDWVAAGQALQHMLLAATHRGLAATPMSQPLEIPQLRKLVADAGGWPQLILCLGHAQPGTPTPRRPLADVLTGLAG